MLRVWELLENWKTAYFNLFIYALFLYSLTFITLHQSIIAVLFAWFTTTIGNSLLLHRYYSHKQFKLNRIVEILLLPFAILCSMGSPITYAAIHRRHHSQTDLITDPHSPTAHGAWVAMTGLLELYPQSYFKKLKTPVPKDLLRDKFLLSVHVNYYRIWLLGFVLTAIINVHLAVVIFSWPAILLKLMANVIVNGLPCHPGINHVRDIPSLGFLTGGESLQEFHHNNPTEKIYSHNVLIDPTPVFIKVLTR